MAGEDVGAEQVQTALGGEGGGSPPIHGGDPPVLVGDGHCGGKLLDPLEAGRENCKVGHGIS